MEKREDLKFYKDKMEKLAPTPEDMRIFWVGKDIARIEARTTYCLECIMEGKGIVSALEDMACLVGHEARLVPDEEKVIIDALMDNNAVLVMPTAEKREAQGGKADETGKEYSIWDRGYAITTGRDPYEAYAALVILEKAAEIQQRAEVIGDVEPLSKSQAKREQRKYLRAYESFGIPKKSKFSESKSEDSKKDANQETPEDAADNVDNTLQELKGRMDLVEYGRELVKSKLIQHGLGNVSIRTGEEDMLVTPLGVELDELSPEDMVAINLKTMKYPKGGNIPTDEAALHAGIYKARPDVGAIVHTHSIYSSVFAACQMPIEIDDLSLRWDLGFMIHASKYAESGSSTLTRRVMEAMEDRPCCIIANHGMVACGKNIEQAYQVALSMEDAARRFLNERQIKQVEKEQNKQAAKAKTEQVKKEQGTDEANRQVTAEGNQQGPVSNALMIIEEPKK